MALIYHPNIRILYAHRGLFLGFTNPFAISVFSGVQPSAETVASNWINYNSTGKGLLWHTQGVGLATPSTSSVTVYASTVPSAVAPLANGTATWCIAWSTNVTLAQVTGATIPTTKFIVADVTNTSGQGTLRFTNTAMSTSTPISLIDFGITVY